MSRRSEVLRAKKAVKDAEEKAAAAAVASQKKSRAVASSKTSGRSSNNAAAAKTTTAATSSKSHRSKANKDKGSSSPRVIVTSITDSDVLLGRGSGIARHQGNVYFRHLVNNARKKYHQTVRNKKMYVAAAVIQNILAQKPPGRFLEHAPKHSTPSNKKYYLVEYKRALEKSCQALREKQPTQEGSVPVATPSPPPPLPVVNKKKPLEQQKRTAPTRKSKKTPEPRKSVAVPEPKRPAQQKRSARLEKPKAPSSKRRKISLRGPSLDEAAAKFKPATTPPPLPDGHDPSPPPPLIVTTSVGTTTSSADESSIADRMKGLSDRELAAIMDLTSLARSASPPVTSIRAVSTTPTTAGRYSDNEDNTTGNEAELGGSVLC